MADKLKEKYDCIISLGSTCAPKNYIDNFIGPGETQFFDWLGSSYMWSINSIIENKWAGITEPENYKMLYLHRGTIFNPVRSLMTNTKYMMQFLHDATSIKEIKSPIFTEKYLRRAARFDKRMREAKNILFIRQKGDLSEKHRNRYNWGTINPYIKGKPSEAEEVERFIPMIKALYGCQQATLLYMNDERAGWNEDKTILYVKCNVDIKFKNSDKVLHQIFTDNKVYEDLVE